MIKKIVTVASLFCLCRGVFAQEEVIDSTSKAAKKWTWKKFLSALTLQNEIDPLPDKPDPATFQLTFPKDGSDSWLVNGAIGYNHNLYYDWKDKNDYSKGKDKWTLTPLFSYHRNTLIDEEQYNWQTGVSVTFANIGRKTSSGTLISHYASMGFKYSRNVIDTVQSLLFTGQYDLYRSGAKGINIGANKPTGPVLHYFSVTPSYQFQYNFQANSKTLEGAIFRPQVTASYELASNLEKKQLSAKKKVSASFEYTARYDAVNSTGVREEYTYLLKTGLNLYLLNNPLTVTISGSYNYGSDPAKGLKQQEFWLIALKVQKK